MRKYNINPSKTLGTQAAHVVTTLRENNLTLFRIEDVMVITGLKGVSARSFIRGLVNRGIASCLRPGLFILVPFELGHERHYLGNPYVVARELMKGKPYYLSHASAMDIHRMTTQPQLVIHATSPKAARNRTIFGTEIRFTRCHKEDFFGVAETWVDKQEKVTVSDLEKTVLDGLKIPKYVGGITEAAKGFWIRRVGAFD